MATFLLVQGIEPVQLAEEESFNRTRSRLNKAAKMKIDYELGNFVEDSDNKYTPFHLLSFKTEDEDGEIGRISINVERIIGIGSDSEKDSGGGE